jgi:GTP cyclohydrolase-4
VKDIHALIPTGSPLTLHKVGVTGIKKPLAVQRPERVVTMTATFAVAVDLPASRKGSDLSRNAELLAELVDATAMRPVSGLERACEDIATELLRRHAYAREAEVQAEAEYFLIRGISEARSSFENYRLLADSRAHRDGDATRVTRSIGAEALGMTACPCAMEGARDSLVAEYPALADPSLRNLPFITHNQRNRTRLVFELPSGAEVEADEMIRAIEASQSSPTYAILKRGDEARLVVEAHRRPKFVEDVIRDLLGGVSERFPTLPDSTVVRAQTVSEESIHKYDVVAAHRATMGELRNGPSGPG